MDKLLVELMIDPKSDKSSLYSNSQLPPRPSLSPRTTSPIGNDRRSPYFRTHSPLTTYESNRETIVRRDRGSPTLAETHLLHKEGSDDSFYSEEHWSSEVSAFVTTSPPKFLQVINPYRVQSTDQLTLLVSVRSDPAAVFTWYFNDTLIPINSQTFVIRNAINASSLTIEEPKQGLYACSATNVAGTSKTYGFITVNYPKQQMLLTEKPPRFTDKGIKFISQVPNLTINPGKVAQFDIEVASQSPSIRFSWQINEKPVADKDVQITYLAPNRSLSRFKNPIPGKYTIIATNEFESIKNDKSNAHSQFLWRRKNSYGSDASDPIGMATSMEDSNYLNGDYLFSKRQVRSPRSSNAGLSKFPCKPKFVQVPSITQQLQLRAGETLNANCNVFAEPPAQIEWFLNKFQLKPSDVIQISSPAENSCTLIHKKPQSGIYRIKASNKYGTAFYEMRVTVDGFVGGTQFLRSQSIGSNDEESLSLGVKKPDGIKDDLPKAPQLVQAFPIFHRLKENQELNLEVQVDAIPAAMFLWRQNNFELRNGQKGVKIFNNTPNTSKLSLDRPIDGRLEVVASNELGKCSASTKIALDYSESMGAQTQLYFAEPLPTSIVEDVKQLNVRVHAREAGTFEWLLDGHVLLNDNKIKTTQGPFHSTLTTTSNLPVNKMLVVVFTNPSGTISSKTRIEQKQVKEPPPIPKKHFRLINGSVQKLSNQQSSDQPEIVVEVERSNEEFNETTQIVKHEEKYSILIKVAEAVAETLVANIILEAIKESAHRLSRLIVTSESEDEDSTFLDQSKSGPEPGFVNSNETKYCMVNETITLNARLNAPLDNYPFQWFKEGSPLSNENLENIKVGANNVELILRNVQLVQAGDYECRLLNHNGGTSYFCRLIVRNPDGSVTVRSPSPNYIESLQNINTNITTSKREENRTIEVLLADDVFEEVCFTITEDIEVSAFLMLDPSAGPQSAQLTSKDEDRIEQAINRQQNQLQKPKVPRRPPKRPIQFKESSNSADESGNAEISISEVSVDSAFTKQPNQLLNEQEKQIFDFNAERTESTKTETFLEVNFVQNEVAFSRAEHLVERTKNGLEILVDSGICVSLSESIQFSTTSQPSTTLLSVPQKKKPSEVPKFIEKLSDVSVKEGSVIQLVCTGSDTQNVKWFFNNQVIEDNESRKAFSSHGINSLRFEKVSKNDEGKYTCEISNLQESISTHAFMKVEEAPKTSTDQTPGPIPTKQISNVPTDIQPNVKSQSSGKTKKRRSKSAERFSRLRVNAMDSLRHFGQRLQRFRERSFSRSTRRSRSSQPVPVEARATAPRKQHSSDLESGQWYFLGPNEKTAENSTTIHKYFESEYQSKVFKSGDRFATKLHASASDDPSLATFEHFYKTPSDSTNTVRHQSLTPDQIAPIKKYVESICNFDNLMDWATIASKQRPTYSSNQFEHYGERRETWTESRQQENFVGPKAEGQLEQCIRRMESNQTTVQKEEIFIEREVSRNEIIRNEITRDAGSTNNFMLLPPQSSTKSFEAPTTSPRLPETNKSFEAPITTTNQRNRLAEVPRSFDEEEYTGSERRVLHGRVFPLSGKVSPAPYLLRTNSTCKTGLITDIAQEWSLVRESQNGHAEAFFFPYAQSQANQSIEEPKPPKNEVKPAQEVPKPGIELPQINIQHSAQNQPLIHQTSQEEIRQIAQQIIQQEIQQQLQQQQTSQSKTQFELNEQRKLAEFEDYVQRQMRLTDRETQTTPRLRLVANQTPDLSQTSTPTRFLTESPLVTHSTSNPIYKAPAEKQQRIEVIEETRKFQTLPTKTQQRLRSDPNDLTLLKQTLLEVEKNAGRAQRRFHKTVSEDARLIEKTILKVSEELNQRGPLSEAQMLASEELLRSKIAEAILNLKPSISYDDSAKNTPTDSLIEVEPGRLTYNQVEFVETMRTEPGKLTNNQVEQIDILRDPIIKLKDKLGKLEQQLIYDEEESIREELRQINSNSMKLDENAVKLRERSMRSRTENVARMTPLIVLVKNKLSSLDSAVDQQAVALDVAKRTKTQGHFVSNETNRSIHRLLMNINEEIAKIHSLCRDNKKIDNVNLVVEVLSKVCRSIDAILEAFQKTDELSEASTSLSTTVASGTPAANVTISLQKPEQTEKTNTLLMFWSDVEKTHNLSTQYDGEFKRVKEESLSTNASVKVQQFAHVQNKFNATPKQEPIKRDLVSQEEPIFKKVENVEEIPEIKLITPTVASKKSEVRSEIGINVQNRSENKRTEALLINNSEPVRGKQKTPPTQTAETATIQVVRKISQEETPVQRKNAKAMLNEDNALSKSQEDEIFFGESVPIPILFPKRSSILLVGPETDIISTDDEDQTNVQIVDVRNNVWEKFKLKKHRRNYRVNAFIYPAVRFQLIATVSSNDFQVDVDCMSEYFYDSFVVLSDSFYASQAYVHEKQKKRDSDLSDEDTLEAHDQPMDLKNYSRMSVSINARSINDAVNVNLEEIPWNEVEATVPSGLNFEQFVEGRNSGYFNVTVSENQDESKSLESSHRSSQKSLVISEQLSQQSMDVPTYIIKQNSTATITVELNPFVQRNAHIEWFKGRQHINFGRTKTHQKYSRVREDHLEVLIINDVQTTDSELFSITVNKEIYPVAYLIIEDSTITMKANRFFVSPPQTMFVMEGQTAILSCQLVNPNMNLTWYKGDELLVNDDRHSFQQSSDNWYRLIIDYVLPQDQGIYYAHLDECSTSISLVVEEPIDEKEVQVSDAETQQELVDYLIPSGSTATIACELNETDAKNLVWQKDGYSIEISSNQNKYEYVRNAQKHYLIIHNSDENDGGIYSVLINGLEFKIASLVVGAETKLSGSRLKQISNSNTSICV